MSKSEFRVLSFYAITISILSLTLAVFGPPLASQIVLSILIGSGLVLLGIVALMRKMEGN